MRAALLGAIFFGLLVCPSHAQKAEPGGGDITLTELIVHTRTKRGLVSGCEIEYKLWFPDHFQSKGQVVALIGAVGIFFDPDAGKQPALILKVRGSDFRDNKFVPFDISYAYLKGANTSLAGKEAGQFRCDDGGACVSYNFMTEHRILDSLISLGFGVSYLRPGSSADVTVPVLFDNAEKANAFSQCTRRLLQTLTGVMERKK